MAGDTRRASRTLVITLADILIVLLVAALAWLVWDSLKAREAANAAIRTACRAHALLFLDDTVALRSIAPTRDDAGRLALRRVYTFDYSDTGDNRRSASVTMIGAVVAGITLPPLPGREALH